MLEILDKIFKIWKYFEKGQVIAFDNRLGPVHTLFWVIRAETLDISYFFRSSHPNVFCKKKYFEKFHEIDWKAPVLLLFL